MRWFRRVGTSVVFCGLAIGAFRPAAEAQSAPQRVHVRLNPSVGFSLPFGGPFIDEMGLRKSPVSSAVFTARLAAVSRFRVGVEGTVAVGRGLVAVRDSLNTVKDVPATLMLASLRALLPLNPGIRDGIELHVAPGVGLIGRSGKAWVDTRPRGVVPALVLAAGGSARLARRAPVAFRFELEDFISRAQFNVGLPTETRARMHHDLIWSLGLSFPILRRG